MVKQRTAIPKAPLARILITAGAGRVSAKGVDAFSDIIGDIAEDISRRALEIAKHAGRKTIHERDIKLSAKTRT